MNCTNVVLKNSDLGKVAFQILGHSEGFELLSAKNLLHFHVRVAPLLILRILQLMFLEIGPEHLDNLGPAQLVVLVYREQAVNPLALIFSRISETACKFQGLHEGVICLLLRQLLVCDVVRSRHERINPRLYLRLHRGCPKSCHSKVEDCCEFT